MAGPALLLPILSCGGPGGADRSPVDTPDGVFTRNEGQIPNGDVLFYHGSGNLRAGFEEGAVVISMVEMPSVEPEARDGDEGAPPSPTAAPGVVDGVLLRLTFPGSHAVRPEGRDRVSFRSHFIHGSDPAGWRTDVPSYREVVYPDLYDGIDLVYRVGEGGLKYEFRCAPDSDPEAIEVTYEGIERMRIGPSGDLIIETAIGGVRDSRPVSYQLGVAEASASSSASAQEVPQREVRSGYVLRSPTSFGFALDGWDGRAPLVIDPLVYSTTLGGGTNEYVRSVAIDEDGFAYAVGWTVSTDFDTTPGAFQTSWRGAQEAFIAKIRTNGKRLVWATYLGGSSYDDAYSVQVDANRFVYIAGRTRSQDLPVTDGSTHSGGRFDAWVVKLSPAGDVLVHGGYLGGSDDDSVCSMAIDEGGASYITGYTRSTDVGLSSGLLGTSHSGGALDAYVAKVDPAGTLAYFVYLGGRSVDYGWGIAVDPAGSAYVAGSTISTDFPVTTDSFDPVYNGTQDAFVAKLSPDGGALVYSGFLGGLRYDRAYSIAVDALGAAYVCGVTASDDFPVTPGAFDVLYGGGHDGFVAVIDPAGSSVGYATYLGGFAFEEVRAIAVDFAGETFVTGYTASDDFPVTPGTFDISHNGGDDAFVTHLSPGGGTVVESTFVGGSGLDRGFGIAVRTGTNQVVAAGETRSADYPSTRRAYGGTLNGVRDGFVVKFRY